MKKIIVIPAYNEEGNLEKTVRDIRENAPDFDYIIVNDCSTDNTLGMCREKGFSYLNLPVNLGIGGAVQTGYRYAYYHGYDLAVQFDGDGQHSAKFLAQMAKVLEETESDMVIGSRFIEKEGFQSSGLRRIGIRYFSLLIKLLTGKTVTDPTSGMRMINRKLLKKFTNEYPKDYPEPESVVTVLSEKHKVTEIPVVMNEREEGISSISLRNSVYYMIKVSFAVVIARMKK
ncbi:glycosyltransferase family 2 protein [Jutongia huaianensis]|jgi:glycosyltransferase involved in cell wall biosynthesis|uniref:Glycosyltransferase family 2 protein n=1 Tax=Jutongia huaianensis TaxID=2763668 RepID=A0ABR7N0Z4_9FIRM|nr:glycosyltransferase family 2 protein [Jutongia huaianensis]MBC8562270.1 glycosyltransferase family 2 protein [Jutongia huaianensis]RHU98858.1 glycosyltransferase family 2 protein [Clostridium sp. OM07-9AC]RHV06205.1 glycosyltransferase family 2 protein [Clostridium sp. OM07-10AC]